MKHCNAICEVEINPRGLSLAGTNLKEIILMMKNLKFIPLIEDKINNDYIENVKVFDIFLQKKLLKKG